MSYPAKECDSSRERDRGGRKWLKQKRGTNIVENNNMRGAKASVDGVTRQRSSLTHKKMVLFAHSHNLKIDANVPHMIGKPAWSRDWFVREALCQKAQDYVKEEMFPLDEFPAPFDKEKHVEPIDKECQKFTHVQWKSTHHQADNIDLFHKEEEMEAMEADTPCLVTWWCIGRRFSRVCALATFAG
jgi:hypothetical protein